MKRATDGMDDSMIPIARPQVGDLEIENVVHVLRSGMLAGGRFGRAALDYITGAGGAVTDSQSGFRALNRKAALLLAGALRREEIEAFGIVAVEDINGWSRTVGLMAAR